MSDHFPTFISINLNLRKKQKPKFITKTVSNLNSLDDLKEEVNTLNFDFEPDSDPNINYNMIQHIITSLIKKQFPVKK